MRDRAFILHPASKAADRAFFLPYAKAVPVSLPASVNRSAVQSQIGSLFWDLYMPQGECMVRDAYIIKCGHPMNWAELVPNVSEQDTSLEDAFSALSVSRVGQGNKDMRLVHESSKVYGRALRELQAALFDPKRMYLDDILMACMLLGLYEVFEGPALNSRSWIAHAQGAARLVELRGPERHQHREAFHPFLASRIPTIYAAILQRKSTYLATDEWLTIPWTSQQRTYFDRLVDLATSIPSILERFDILRQHNSDEEQELLTLLEQCVDLQEQMDRWRRNAKKTATPRVQCHDPTDQEVYPFKTDLWFENHLFAHARLVHYACSLALADVADDVIRALSSRDWKPPEHLNISTLKEHFEAERHAANICRTVPFCLNLEMGAWGANIINFPANLAYSYFQKIGYVEATEWLVRAFEAVKNRGVHAENVFVGLFSKTGVKHELDSNIKRESSTDTADTGASSSSSRSSGSMTATFIYEDPSQFYYDASNDPG